MIYILAGPDDFSVARELDKIKRETGDRESLEMNTAVLDGRQVTLEQLAMACDTLPFLVEKRLVIINGLLSRFEPKKNTGRRGKGRTKETPNDTGPFSECLLRMPESTVLVIIEETVNPQNPLYKALGAKAKTRNFPLIRGRELQDWVQRQVAAEKSQISPKAASLLTRLVGSNLWVMASEIQKLALYASGRKIEEADVNTLVGYTQQTSVFNLVDAVLEFRTEQAEKLLQEQLRMGDPPSYMLIMLARQVRMIILAKDMSRKRMSNIEIQNRLGIKNDFVIRKTLEQASRYSIARLKEVYHSILDTDVAIKTGKLAEELALYLLVAELSARGSRPPARSAAGLR